MYIHVRVAFIFLVQFAFYSLTLTASILTTCTCIHLAHQLNVKNVCFNVTSNCTSIPLMSQVHVHTCMTPQLSSVLISSVYLIHKVHQAMVTIAAHRTKDSVVSVRMM